MSATLPYRVGEEAYMITKTSRGIDPTSVQAIKVRHSLLFSVKQKMLEGLTQL